MRALNRYWIAIARLDYGVMAAHKENAATRVLLRRVGNLQLSANAELVSTDHLHIAIPANYHLLGSQPFP